MISIESPSMVINDRRAPAAYHMDHTEGVDVKTSMQSIVNKIVAAASLEPLGRIRGLVLNAHGVPGRFLIGQGLSMSTMDPFEALQGKVHKIWFKGCLVARIIRPSATPTEGDALTLQQVGIVSGNGHRFVSAFARLTGCYVVASTEIQARAVGRTQYPRGLVDAYEGLVLSYNPQGNISWQHRYQSVWGYNSQNGTFQMRNRE